MRKPRYFIPVKTAVMNTAVLYHETRGLANHWLSLLPIPRCFMRKPRYFVPVKTAVMNTAVLYHETAVLETVDYRDYAYHGSV